MTFLALQDGDILDLPAHGARPASVHVFDAPSIDAVNAALAARRPLLLRGEPGTGKSQLARAAAVALGRAFHSSVIDAMTEPRDLLWRLDSVTRLAEAQLVSTLKVGDEQELRRRLHETAFLEPGPLWWALDWTSAAEQSARTGCVVPAVPKGWTAADGVVLLIDEIDKADASVPNGLLEALGQGRFTCPGGRVVGLDAGVPSPLVMITTNEERALPAAFLRRCLVHHLSWPTDRDALIDALKRRGMAHFSGFPEEALDLAARMVAGDRRDMLDRRLSPPGGAEFLDLLRAARGLAGDESFAAGLDAEDETGRLLEILRRVGCFTLKKHPEAAES